MLITEPEEARKAPHKTYDRFPYLLAIIGTLWIPIGLATPLIGLFQAHDTFLHILASIVGLFLFVGIYLWTTWSNVPNLATPSPLRARVTISSWLTIGVLTLLGVILTLSNGNNWAALFIFTNVYITSCLPTRQAIWMIVVISLLTAVIALTLRVSWLDFGWAVFIVAIVGLIVLSMRESLRVNQELRAAREEIARLAVTSERLRIARDLHDLLGHNLSLITLKSELAGRLIGVAPERAAIEIRDVEQVARTTLQEVREAVGNYRQPTLLSELHAAQELLTAAGIAYRYEEKQGSKENLPTPLETVLAWSTREGITNVIRHSRAHHCVIHLARHQDEVHIEIIDDGTAFASADQSESAITSNRGNGLRGLAERIAVLGGTFEAGPQAGGGFRLAVSVPLVQRTETISSITGSSSQERPIISLEHASSSEERRAHQ